MLLFIGDSIIGQLTKKDKLVEDLSLIAFNGGAFIENVLKNSLCTEQEMTTAIHPNRRPNRRRGPTPAPIVWTSCNSIADFESKNVKFHGFVLKEEPQDDAYYLRISTFMKPYLTTMIKVIDGFGNFQGYWPTDNLMLTLSAMDQSKWPLSLEFSSEDRNDLIRSFRDWPNLFPNFPGPQILTAEIMDESLQKILNFLSNTDKSGTFWCQYHNGASPTEFWSVLLLYMEDELNVDFIRLVKATLSVPYGKGKNHFNINTFGYEILSFLQVVVMLKGLSACLTGNFHS